MPKLPPNPLYAFFLLPRGRLLKVHAEPCMYAPGYLQSNRAALAGSDDGIAARLWRGTD
jgi:hypothetical protein